MKKAEKQIQNKYIHNADLNWSGVYRQKNLLSPVRR